MAAPQVLQSAGHTVPNHRQVFKEFRFGMSEVCVDYGHESQIHDKME